MTNSKTKEIKEALSHLQKDPVMKKLIKKHGPLKWDWKSDIFEDIIETIINQQLSGKAAATIFKRFKKLFGKSKFPTPDQILKQSDETIRECGISFSKISYIKGVCQAVKTGKLELKKLPKLDDDEVMSELTKLKGIGIWTAEMTLMFSLKRPDVFSIGDLGLRTAVSNLYHVRRDNLKKIEKISNRWKPYRTYASRYLWKSVDNK